MAKFDIVRKSTFSLYKLKLNYSMSAYREIFVYNICFSIGMSELAFYQAAKIYVLKSLKGHKTTNVPRNLNPW